MANLTFYHQVRADGGKRTGIETADVELAHLLEPGPGNPDPALLWYVDIECNGDGLPNDPGAARNWFLDHQVFFVDQLVRIADEELGAGFDVEPSPFRRDLAGPDGTTVRIAISAVRRLVAREIAENVQRLARDGPRGFHSLHPSPWCDAKL